MPRKNRKKNMETVQKRAIDLVDRLMQGLRGVQDKAKCGGYGSGNDFSVDDFAADMDRHADVELEMWFEDHE